MIFSAQSYASLAQLCLSVAITGHVEAASNSQPDNPEGSSASATPIERVRGNFFRRGRPAIKEGIDLKDRVKLGKLAPLHPNETVKTEIKLIGVGIFRMHQHIGFSIKGDDSGWKPVIKGKEVILVKGNIAAGTVETEKEYNLHRIGVFYHDTNKIMHFECKMTANGRSCILLDEEGKADVTLDEQGILLEEGVNLQIGHPVN
ncbi:hypothetical protein ENBRE01_0988 [Enteropsectra breve]|nr:hypothetical protein ENBRE01_0988 [Enteropsectra breve]